MLQDQGPPQNEDSLSADEFLGLLAHHEAQVMGFLWSISWTGEDAEELFQQTVITMWRQLPQFQRETNFVAWACRIARLKAYEYSREKRRTLLLSNELIDQLAHEFGEEDYELRQIRRRALDSCLTKIRDEDRSLIQDCYRGDRSFKEVAQKIGRSARSLYKSLARIRKTLHDCIELTVKREEC